MAPSSSPALQQSQGEKKKGVKKMKKKAVMKLKAKPVESADPKPKNGSKKRKPKKIEGYSRFIFKAMRIQNPQATISSKAMSIMNSFTNDMFENIASEAGRLVKARKGKTMSARDIEFATKLIVPGELAKHASAEGIKAMTRLFGKK